MNFRGIGGCLYRFQLCHVHRIGVLCTGRHVCNLAGHCRTGRSCRFTDRNSSRCRFPCACRIISMITARRVIAGDSSICICHTPRAKRYATCFLHIGIVPDGNGIRHVCRDCSVSGAEDNTAGSPCKFSLIAENKGVICIFHFIFGTDDGYMINIFAGIQISVNHIICTRFIFCSGELVSYADQFGELGVISHIRTADSKDGTAAVFHQSTQRLNHLICIPLLYRCLQRIGQRSGRKGIHRTIGVGDFISCAEDQGCIGIFRLIRHTDDAVRHTVKIYAVLCPDNVKCAVNGRGRSLEAGIKAVDSVSVHTGESACHSRSRTVGCRARTGRQRHTAFRPIIVIIACMISCIVHAVIMCFSRFQLRHVDGISVLRTCRHTCDLAGNPS